MAKRISITDPGALKRISVLEAALEKSPQEIVSLAMDAYWQEKRESVKDLLSTLGVSDIFVDGRNEE